SGTVLGAIGLQRLLQLPTMQQLRKLQLNRCGSARMNLSAIAESPYWNQAEELGLRGGTIPARLLEPLILSRPQATLRRLDLGGNFLRTEGLQMLAAAPWASHLTWLSLTQNYLDDVSLEAFVEGPWRSLQTLLLSRNSRSQTDSAATEQITDRGVATLCLQGVLQRLRYLNLDELDIEDQSVERVLMAPRLPLFGLGLSQCDLSPRVVEILAESPRLASLQWLDLSRNVRLAGKVLAKLADSPYLSPLCELHVGQCYVDSATLLQFRERLGHRLVD
ncbi:MAG: hypothetical protein ACRCZF_20300, partial [Gemmataceae bacterium]